MSGYSFAMPPSWRPPVVDDVSGLVAVNRNRHPVAGRLSAGVAADAKQLRYFAKKADVPSPSGARSFGLILYVLGDVMTEPLEVDESALADRLKMAGLLPTKGRSQYDGCRIVVCQGDETPGVTIVIQELAS